MANLVKQAIAKAKIEDQIVELMVKSQITNVYMEDGVTTLASKLADILSAIDDKADSTAVTAEIKAAIDDLIGGAPETYDTLKEIAEYIAAHEEVVDALNEAIGNKVSKEEGKGLSANDFTDALKEKLESIPDNVAANQNAFSYVKVGDAIISASEESDTVNLVAGDNVTLTPDAVNKSVKIDVTAHVTVDAELSDTSENAVQNKVVKAAIDAKPNVYIQETEPVDMKANDIWLQIIN